MITLVHGTWPRGFFPKSLIMRLLGLAKPLWFQRKSPFREKLESSLKEASLDCEIRPFCWSGANAVFARDGAAQELARLLKDDLKSGNAPPIVIAHSHGGNVALRAMTHLGADASRVRIVTLATPFLRVFVGGPLEGTNFLSVFFSLWVAIAAIGGTLLMLIFASIFTVTNLSVDFMYWGLGSYAAGAVVSFFVVARLLDDASDRPLKIQQAAAYNSRDTTAPRMLVIRGVDDEAALFLAAGAIGARLSHYILVGAIRWVVVAYFGTVLLSATVLDKATADPLLKSLSAVLALGALVFYLLFGVFKSVFGKEFVREALRCEIAADSMPDTSGPIDAMTLAPDINVSRHGIYGHPKCVSEIVGWLRPGR
jgi:hypothetical protein